jgi:hypothetical protein
MLVVDLSPVSVLTPVTKPTIGKAERTVMRCCLRVMVLCRIRESAADFSVAFVMIPRA